MLSYYYRHEQQQRSKPILFLLLYTQAVVCRITDNRVHAKMLLKSC